MRAEELAVAECTCGLEVRRVWTEQEMVRSFGGMMFPGTPDGMFETWDGALTCVQVVRVPLVAGMTIESMQAVITHTVVTKVVKSQQWLRACHVVPHDFVIFCWLPFTIPGEVAEDADLLMQRVRVLDNRFSLRLRVPAQPGALFPAMFAHVSYASRAMAAKDGARTKSTYSEDDISRFDASTDLASDDDEEGCAWDITWSWDSESPLEECEAGAVTEAAVDADDGVEDGESSEFEWDITWEWQADTCESPDGGGRVLEVGDCQQQDRDAGAPYLLPASREGLPWDDGG